MIWTARRCLNHSDERTQESFERCKRYVRRRTCRLCFKRLCSMPAPEHNCRMLDCQLPSYGSTTLEPHTQRSDSEMHEPERTTQFRDLHRRGICEFCGLCCDARGCQTNTGVRNKNRRCGGGVRHSRCVERGIPTSLQKRRDVSCFKKLCCVLHGCIFFRRVVVSSLVF